jgi:hypothetical protein
LCEAGCAQEIITPVRQRSPNVGSHNTDYSVCGFHGSGDRRRRAIAGRQYQKDFFDTDSHAGAKKEAVSKEDVTFAEPFAEKEIFASPGKGVAHSIRCCAN